MVGSSPEYVECPYILKVPVAYLEILDRPRYRMLLCYAHTSHGFSYRKLAHFFPT